MVCILHQALFKDYKTKKDFPHNVKKHAKNMKTYWTIIHKKQS